MLLCWLRLDRLNVEHLICRAEACRFVEAAALFRRVKGYDADAAPACFGKRQFDEIRRQVAAAIFRFNVNIEQVSAPAGLRIERVRRPVEQQQARSSDDFAILFTEPTEVFSLGDGLRNPGFVRLNHQIQKLIVAPAGVNKHAPAMACDEWSVGGRSRPCVQHDEQYRA